MKALVLEAYNQFTYKEVADPKIADNEVLVRVKAAGICGSDVHGMDGSTGRRLPPVIMGHEAAGEIAAVGSDVTNWKAGDRVTFDSTIFKKDDWFTRQGHYQLSDGKMVVGVSTPDFRKDGAFAEYVVLPDHILYKLPDAISYTQAAFVEPAGVALHGIEITQPSMTDIVVVVGVGMVGSFVLQLLKIRGCRKVIAVDIDDFKLELARKLGADHAFLPNDPKLMETVKGLTDGRGADVVFEVVGEEDSVNTCISAVRKGGKVTLIGNVTPTINFPVQSVVTREIRVQGSCAINGEYPAVLDLIASGRLDVTSILSAEAPLSEGAAWFDRLYNKEKGLMKVMLKP
ncbi:MAG: galactitol-1-phosphate 5-dehydrogenase [Imperialibacter sp.]|uniref:galactitol-1-phosphate 5-dehydrogenase n=1 Tax=Imperialibacter sp. TaxID=2038411 RepID=UPI0032ED04C0